MSHTENHDEELKNLLQGTADEVRVGHYSRFSDFLTRLGLHSELNDKENIPLEIWAGRAQALADASGYRVNLQAQVLEPIEDDPKRFKLAGLREIAAASPTCFVKAIETSADLESELNSARFIKVFVS